ncbi:nuclear transport factor 2 family protein [Paenibacillus lautus]|uniref:nuclear transport factor 2 family protein n=1 Tax=Paenibacillus lautus TaxID=1401 RepID=UPI001C0FA5E7|nr:nuclear transport factor 2 family protein [Paenibacillus lautus]MBU5349591.1 nuclear transport factor 2 family protein [Paenibacillus lautus]
MGNGVTGLCLGDGSIWNKCQSLTVIRSMPFSSITIIIALRNCNFVFLLRYGYRYFFQPPTEEDTVLLQKITDVANTPNFRVPIGGMHALEDYKTAIYKSIHHPERGKRFFIFSDEGKERICTVFVDLLQKHIKTWGEKDRTRRHELIESIYSENCYYVDPIDEITGRDEIDRLIERVQTQFPGFTFDNP